MVELDGDPPRAIVYVINPYPLVVTLVPLEATNPTIEGQQPELQAEQLEFIESVPVDMNPRDVLNEYRKTRLDVW